MERVVAVHESTDLLDVVERLLRKELGEHVPIDRFAAHDDAALAAILDADCRFAVLGAAAPGRTGDAPDNVGHAALKGRLAQVFAGRPGLPFLVLATESDDDLCGIVAPNRRGRLALLSPGSDWRAVSRRCARE